MMQRHACVLRVSTCLCTEPDTAAGSACKKSSRSSSALFAIAGHGRGPPAQGHRARWPRVWRRRDACVWCSTSIVDVPVLDVTERSSLYAQRRDKSEPLNVTRDARHVPVERTVSSNSIFINVFQLSHGRLAHCVSRGCLKVMHSGDSCIITAQHLDVMWSTHFPEAVVCP